ncbi:MAG: sigma 54-interacting transcriptional regulator, partial [SAR324 cluster bacterium]|nr:sigma 54-interacting transcriptional regulator [SAR324 cluster bacterium]
MNKIGQKFLILFISSGNDNYQLVAEAITKEMGPKSVFVMCATLKRSKMSFTAKPVIGAGNSSPPTAPIPFLDDIELYMFDLIISLGDSDQFRELSPPAMIPYIHWEVPSLDFAQSKDASQKTLAEARNIILTNLKTLYGSELLKALFDIKHNLKAILDNLLDGVMAHTKDRIIFFFNRAAETITGYKREQVLGKDCHKIFPGRFCGGDCEYCETTSLKNKGTVSERSIDFIKKDGRKRNLTMSIMSLSDENMSDIGALLSFKDVTELEILRNKVKHHHSIGPLVGKDPKMLALFEQIREVAPVKASVLLQGESGTGKEMVAKAIHESGPRKNRPFVAINCGALPEGILESELFGHVKGAFTGAIKDKKGRFELADGGTLLLDEVSELSPAMQVKLLRVLQEHSFEKVGGEKQIHVDVRIISATNRRLKEMIKQKQFRKDLYYRLCVVPIDLPPLRERRLDIPMLADFFLEQIGKEINSFILSISNEATDALSQYSWPGNVRELRNAIEYGYVKCYDNLIRLDHLPPE